MSCSKIQFQSSIKVTPERPEAAETNASQIPLAGSLDPPLYTLMTESLTREGEAEMNVLFWFKLISNNSENMRK